MMTFLIGLVLGGGIVVAAIRGRASLGGARSAIEKLILVTQSGNSAHADGIGGIADTLKEDAPDLLRAIQQPPAVPVDDQPAELPQSIADEIAGARSEKAAVEIARQHIRNEDVAKVYAAAVRWKPKFFHLTERKYQDSLAEHFFKSYKEEHVVQQYRLPWSFEDSDDHKTAKPDYMIGNPAGSNKNKVLVELKADLLSSSAADRALGQMCRYLLAWKQGGPAILIVGGYAPDAIRSLVRYYVSLWRENMQLPVMVYFKRYDDAVEGANVAASISAEKS